MLFENREGVIDVSEPWREARDAFHQGRSREAWALSRNNRGRERLSCANDFLLQVEIARACGAYKKSLALATMAHRQFRDDVYTQLYMARVLDARQLQWPAIQYLEARETTVGRAVPALWASQLASVLGDTGFDTSCRRRLEQAERSADANSAVVLYGRSCANHGMRNWGESIRLVRACVTAAPRWTRASAFLISCLLSQERIEEATSEIRLTQASGCEDSSLDFAAAMLAFSMGHFAAAEPMFQSLLAHWPDADFCGWARRTLCILLVELGRPDDAAEVATGFEARLSLPLITSDIRDSPHRFIPLPLIAQNKNECVPTCVAMTLWPHNHRFDPAVLFQEMQGREGVALWKMRQWAVNHGCRVIAVRLNADAVVQLLDLRVPLIGVLEGPFSSHVETVCGYHSGLGVLYVRDPEHWVPVAYPLEPAMERYQLHGALLAIIPESLTHEIALADSLRDDVGTALLDLAQAVASADRPAAEVAYQRINDDSPVSFMRDLHGNNVVISSSAFRKRMGLLAQDADANPVARFRALLAIGSREAQTALEAAIDEDSAQLGSFARRFLLLRRHMSDGLWSNANEQAEWLLRRGGGLSDLWELKSDIEAELANEAASQEAFDRALELQPMRPSLHQKSLDRRTHHLTMSEYISELNRLVQENADDKRLLWTLATTLMDGPDGAECEAAVREHLRWYPRDAIAYMALMRWYNVQERPDLIEVVLAEARTLLPDVWSKNQESVDANETAKLADEQSTTTESTFADPGASANSVTPPETATLAETAPLPESVQEILDIAWDNADPRNAAAIEKAIQLESEGQLTWDDRARLLARRLIPFPGASPLSVASIRTLLPDSTPGSAHWFAITVADLVTSEEVSVECSRELVAWIDRVVPNYRKYAGLWFNRVLLLESARETEKAIQNLQDLIKINPAYSTALYRMGVVKFRQVDYAAAKASLQKALHINPGLPGAIQGLQSVHARLDERDGVLECIRRMRRKFPHGTSYWQEELLAVAEGVDASAALKLLEETRAGFPPVRVELIRCRLYLLADNIDTARDVLAAIAIDENDHDDVHEDLLWLKLNLARRENNSRTILEICEQGLKRWPNSTRLMEIQAEFLTEADGNHARDILQRVLWTGEPSLQTAWQFVQLAGSVPHEAAQALIREAPSTQRVALAVLFSKLFHEPSLLASAHPFLEWASQEFPDNWSLLQRYAWHLNVYGQHSKAVTIAERVHANNPEDLDAMHTLGRCLIDTDTSRARKLLEMVCSIDRSTDHLFDLARCCQADCDSQIARKLHWEILNQNPYVCASWTNLFCLNEDHVKLWPWVTPFLKRGYGVDDEYCLAAVVKVATALGHVLPKEWYPLAVQRFQVLETYPGFRDERRLLIQALQAWRIVRPDDGPPPENLPCGFFATLMPRWSWPRTRWIPRDP